MSTLRLWNGEELRVGKIIGLARSYPQHAKEMGGSPPTAPIFFLKPASSLLHDGGTVRLPRSQRVDHEIELGIVIGARAKDVPEPRWEDFVLGYCVLLDMTARDLQEEAKKRGEPWALSKGFDTFCPVSAVVERARVGNPQSLDLELRVNGSVRQRGNTRDMLIPLPRVVAYLSSVMTLERGDLIATGTPEGVGPVRPGDRLEARIPNVATVTVSVA